MAVSDTEELIISGLYIPDTFLSAGKVSSPSKSSLASRESFPLDFLLQLTNLFGVGSYNIKFNLSL